MTDARYPERWLNDRRLLRLSDAAFRLYVTALVWSVSNRTDGMVCDEDLRLMPGVDPGRTDELVKSGLWERRGDIWIVADFENTQTTSVVLAGLDHKRAMDRDRQARHRAHKRGDHHQCLPDHCDQARRVTRDVTRDT